MKNFISIDNLDLKSSSSIKSFITASSEINDCLIRNVLQDDKNIWLSEDFLPQEIILNFRNIKLKEYPKKLTAIGVYCWNKFPTNPKIIEVLISKEKGSNFISLGHFDLSFKAGRQLIYLDDENDIELEELLSSVDFNDLIIKLIIKETFGGKHTYINNLYLYDELDTININISNNNMNINSNSNINNTNNIVNADNNNKNEDNKENNDLNNDNNGYMMIQENDIYENENDTNRNLNIINNKEEANVFNKLENEDNIKPNGNEEENENEEQNLKENVQNTSNQNLINDNDNQNMNYEQEKYNKKQVISKNVREVKTPIMIKEFLNMEERPLTAKSLTNRNINKTGSAYNNTPDIDNNIGFNNGQYNEMQTSDRLNYLLNEFKNFREHQEYIMNNYETRVRLLEEKCFELNNNMKKMNATMNTIIESQYSQNQASNDYLLRECHNMVNEAIVNILSNMGRNFNTYNPQMFGNQNMLMNPNRNRNINNINFFDNYGNHMPKFKYNNNYVNEQNFLHREMGYEGINNLVNNDLYNEDNISNNNFLDENENGNESDKINMNNNNHEEEYLEKEISYKNEEEEQYNNNDINKGNENKDDYILTNKNTTIKINNNKNINYDTNRDKKLKSSELYNESNNPYNEKMKVNSNKMKNIFSNSINNYKENNNINTNNNFKNNVSENDNLNYNNTLIKSRSITNIKSKEKNKNFNTKKEINKSYQIYTEKRNTKRNKKPPIIKIDDNDLSSDNSLDNIEINTKITENILKPTLEKFESYMNVNNFGKSQNVYSMNTFNKKKEIFGDNNNDKKLNKTKGNKEK